MNIRTNPNNSIKHIVGSTMNARRQKKEASPPSRSRIYAYTEPWTITFFTSSVSLCLLLENLIESPTLKIATVLGGTAACVGFENTIAQLPRKAFLFLKKPQNFPCEVLVNDFIELIEPPDKLYGVGLPFGCKLTDFGVFNFSTDKPDKFLDKAERYVNGLIEGIEKLEKRKEKVDMQYLPDLLAPNKRITRYKNRILFYLVCNLNQITEGSRQIPVRDNPERSARIRALQENAESLRTRARNFLKI